MLLHASGNGSGHALRGDGDIWVDIMAVCFRKELEMNSTKYMRHRIVIRVPRMESLVDGDQKEWG